MFVFLQSSFCVTQSWNLLIGDTLYTLGSPGNATTTGITSYSECIARREYSMVWSGKYWMSLHTTKGVHWRVSSFEYIIYITHIHTHTYVHRCLSCRTRRSALFDIFSRIDATKFCDRRRKSSLLSRAWKYVCNFMFEKRESVRGQ